MKLVSKLLQARETDCPHLTPDPMQLRQRLREQHDGRDKAEAAPGIASREGPATRVVSPAVWSPSVQHSLLTFLLLATSFYRAVLVDLLTSRSNDFFDFIFGQLFSRKVKGNLNGKAVGYEELHAHFRALRATYFAHTADGVLRFGPFLASSKHGERDGYLAAASVVASLAQDSAENHAAGQLHYNALMVTDTLEVQWVEGKAGESRRITRFDRTTTRPVRSP